MANNKKKQEQKKKTNALAKFRPKKGDAIALLLNMAFIGAGYVSGRIGRLASYFFTPKSGPKTQALVAAGVSSGIGFAGAVVSTYLGQTRAVAKKIFALVGGGGAAVAAAPFVSKTVDSIESKASAMFSRWKNGKALPAATTADASARDVNAAPVARMPRIATLAGPPMAPIGGPSLSNPERDRRQSAFSNRRG